MVEKRKARTQPRDLAVHLSPPDFDATIVLTLLCNGRKRSVEAAQVVQRTRAAIGRLHTAAPHACTACQQTSGVGTTPQQTPSRSPKPRATQRPGPSAIRSLLLYTRAGITCSRTGGAGRRSHKRHAYSPWSATPSLWSAMP
eukprot:1595956-Pleurochrysis_carterae.AAC.2